MVRFKKGIAVLLAAAMVCSMAGCGKKNDVQDENSVATEGDATAGDAVEAEATEAAEEEEDVQLVDGQVIFDIDFDDGDLHGFGTYTNGGTFDLSVEDGKLVADIQSCGSVDYANQAYMDGFMLSHGCVYTYSFEISSDIERQVEYRLQINGSDYHAYVGDYITVTTEPQTISVDFEMTDDSDPAPRLVFNMGRMEDMDVTTAEHNIYIDNVKLTVKDASNAEIVQALPTPPVVTASQVGYRPEDEKTAITSNVEDTSFSVIDAATGESVYEGSYGDAVYDKGAAHQVKQGDFSAVTTPGTYYISSESGDTYEFTIADDVYSDIYQDVVLMLYNQRCGTELDSSISGEFAHEACHTDGALVYGSSDTTLKDVSGGWHDAGDYGRYVVPGAKTVQDLFLTYEDYNQTSDSFGIPESGNGIPDILDEAKYELDWMLKMQDESSGGVYHKVSCLLFPDTVMPEEETDQLYLAPISAAATGDFAAVMAKASVLYAEYDADFAATCLAAAEKAWNYVKVEENQTGYKNPEDIETGEYPDGKVTDEVFWAAAELYLATGNEEYKQAAEDSMSNNVKSGLGWATIGSYAMYDLVKNNAELDAEIMAQCKQSILDDADYILDKGGSAGYFMSLLTDYPWGSNMTVANNGMILLMAEKITGDSNYGSFAKKQLDYLLGANSVGYCFVTGYGTVSPENPHHRPSEVVGSAMAGMLVGGPDSALEDSYAKAVLYESSPAQCYVDNVQSYSCNEVTIYWNSPLIYLLTAFQ